MKPYYFCRLLILAFLVAASHAASSSEEYWKKLLPNIPMPKAIQDSLRSDGNAAANVGSKGVDVSAGKPGKGAANVHVGKGGASVSTGGHKGKRVIIIVDPKHKPPFLYQYAATKTQLHDDPNVALFFLEKDLKTGTQMNLHFMKTTTNSATFLPRPVAKSIPFSSNKIDEILSQFEISPRSKEAKVVEETIKECEDKGIEGEEKYCATSLESMLDYVTSKLGSTNVASVSSYAEKGGELQKYTFTGVQRVKGMKTVVCHKMNYAYAVFYCHKSMTTKTYMVSLVGKNGVKVKAAAVCHMDTSKWNPKHLAFQVLKVRPGTVPICHFLPEDHVVWVR